MPVTMGVLVDCITAIAKAISSKPLLRAIHRPEPSAAVAQCFGNVQRKAERDGGGVLFGWMFHYREVAAIPGPGYVIAVNHAVWHSPGKKLIDVTPFHADERHHPITAAGAVLFLADRRAAPLKNERAGLALPSWFFPLLSEDSHMAEHVAKAQSDELSEWATLVAGADGLHDNGRATAVLTRWREVYAQWARKTAAERVTSSISSSGRLDRQKPA